MLPEDCNQRRFRVEAAAVFWGVFGEMDICSVAAGKDRLSACSSYLGASSVCA